MGVALSRVFHVCFPYASISSYNGLLRDARNRSAISVTVPQSPDLRSLRLEFECSLWTLTLCGPFT
ncbi:hypothetical protein F2Q70_00027755 [Brassica cretica]|uniref:Uncharacterized protein n=1 Tax=Brassica cretica TaxID=69181 RepID=A0A8S9IFH1_BRACR|nr:hypothetical protein F2Q68_00027311 [Brassica cretica]KAF2604552.1 hypothetical protein F2Q70_00027755 [Brassica cretica]